MSRCMRREDEQSEQRRGLVVYKNSQIFYGRRSRCNSKAMHTYVVTLTTSGATQEPVETDFLNSPHRISALFNKLQSWERWVVVPFLYLYFDKSQRSWLSCEELVIRLWWDDRLWSEVLFEQHSQILFWETGSILMPIVKAQKFFGLDADITRWSLTVSPA